MNGSNSSLDDKARSQESSGEDYSNSGVGAGLDESKPAAPLRQRSPSPQAAQTGPLLTGPGGAREQKRFILKKLSSSEEERVKKAKKYAMEESIKSVLLKQTLAQQQQMATIQNALHKPFSVLGGMQITEQVWTKLGTIYVGSINFDVREDTIQMAFQPFGPIRNVSLSWDALANKHKGFAFVEYDVPEAATLALEQMNGVLLSGRNIKVGRPSNMPQAQPIVEKLMEEAKSYNRIYVASVHTDLSEFDVQSVFEAFGPVRSCKLQPDVIRPGKHKGYGFIEYDSAQAASDAVASMNLFNLGGQYLRVGKAVTPPCIQQVPSFPTPMPTKAAVAAATVTAKITAMDAVMQPHGIVSVTLPPPGVAIPQLGAPGLPATIAAPGVVIPQLSTVPRTTTTPALAASTVSAHAAAAVTNRLTDEDSTQTLAQQENMQITGTQARHMVMQKLSRSSEMKVMVLRNMVGVDDVDDDLENEVVDECSRYGNVNRVVIYQEKQSEADDAEVLVKIFVEFKESASVGTAVKALNGRFFAGRKLRAEPYEQHLFDANDLSG